MAAINIADNIFDRESFRTIYADEGEFCTVRDAVERLVGESQFKGRLLECWNPETGETTYEPMDDGDSLCVSVFANGEEVSLEKEIKENDDILIIVLPAGGMSREGAGWLGFGIGLLVAIAISAVTFGVGSVMAGGTFAAGMASAFTAHLGTTIIMAACGAVAGFMMGQSIYDMMHRGNGESSSLEGKSYPGVKGTKNQSLLNKNYPFILGRHLMTPPYIVPPYAKSSGKYGEKQSVTVAFTAGYAPLRLTEFMLGDLILAHNKPIEKSPGTPTVMNGKLRSSIKHEVGGWVDATPAKIQQLLNSGDLYEKEMSEWVLNPNYYGGTVWDSSNKYIQSFYTIYAASPLVATVRVLNASSAYKGDVQYLSVSDDSGEDTGEILRRWNNNNIELEILQQNPDAPVNWGTVADRAVQQDEVNATPLYVVDGLLGTVAKEYGVTYQGCYFDNGFRNNSVRFSRSYPMKVEIELEATSGLFSTYSTSDDSGNSVTHYDPIPCWYAIQWRPYKSGNADSNAEMSDATWHSFDYINKYTDQNGLEQTALLPQTYTEGLWQLDKSAHVGNSFATDINAQPSIGWIGASLFNLGALVPSGTANDRDRMSMQRFTASVDLSALGVDYLRKNILNLDVPDSEKSNGSNTNHTIEVRVIRVSAGYLNQHKSNSKNLSAYNFTDIVKWNTLTTIPFDEDELADNRTIVPKKITTEEEMRKLCVVAFKADADIGGQIKGQLQKLNFIAESFSPTFKDVDGVKKIFPEGVEKITKYYAPFTVDPQTGAPQKYDLEHPITKEAYEELRRQGKNAIKRKGGNDFTLKVMREIFSETPDGYGRICLSNPIKEKYVNNNCASSALLSLVGRQNGVDALGYEDLDLDSFADFYDFCEEVVDGSTYPADETVIQDDLSSFVNKKGELVKLKYTCNACVTNSIKVETLFQKALASGRALFVRNQNNKIKVVVDKPKEYPVMLINQQNVISGTNTITYENVPSGLQFNFEDEEDGYTGHSLCVMADGEDSRNPTKEIESCSIDYVTNRHQIFSLGRYSLASRMLQKETLTRKIGPEGFCAEVGDLVKVSDDTILIGTDLGGRVKEIIEDSNYIYGIVTDETWKFTGDTETYIVSEQGAKRTYERCVQGAELLQPTKYKEARVVSYRCALPGSSVTMFRVSIDGNVYTTDGTLTVDGVQYEWIDNTDPETRKYFDGHYYEKYFKIDGEIYPVYEVTYKMVVGDTNLMLFHNKISKAGNYAYTDDSTAMATYHKPEIGDIVAFGKVGEISALYLVTKIKPDKDFNFDLTLSQYDKGIYTAGKELPLPKTIITIPDRSGEDYFPLKEGLTLDEIQRLVDSATQATVDRISSGLVNNEYPDIPIIASCKASRDGITLRCAGLPAGAKNTVMKVSWQKVVADGPVAEISEEQWNQGSLPDSFGMGTFYEFNRATDGFPEAEDLNELNGFHKWWFRARVTNIYNKQSESWSVPVYVDTSAYGTWIVTSPQVARNRVSGRTVTMEFDQRVLSNGKEIYGDILYKVEIKRADSASPNYFDPAEMEDPYESEENYKAGGELAVPSSDDQTVPSAQYLKSGKSTTHAFTQTLPLEGQNDKLYKLQWHYTACPPESGETDHRRIDTYGEVIQEGFGTSWSKINPSSDWVPITEVYGTRGQAVDTDSDGTADEITSDELPGFFEDIDSDGDGNPEREDFGRVYGAMAESGTSVQRESVFRFRDEIYELVPDENNFDWAQVFYKGLYYNITNRSFAIGDYEFTISQDKKTVTAYKSGTQVDAPNDVFKADKTLTYTIEDGINPVDTPYIYKITAYNAWNGTVVNWADFITLTVTALATSVKDIVEGAISHAKLDKAAVWADNIAAGSVTADKIAVRDLYAITGVFGKIQNNQLLSSAYNFWDLNTGRFHVGTPESIADPDSDDAEYIDFNPASGNLTIKIANFIIKTITSIIQGVFIVRSKIDVNKRVLMVANPESSAQSDCPARTVKINGDFDVSGTVTGTLGHSLTIKQKMGGQATTDTYNGSVDKEITIEGYNQSLNTSDSVRFSQVTVGNILRVPLGRPSVPAQGMIWCE